MSVIQIDKDSDSIIFISDDGTRRAESIRSEDTVISVPLNGFKKVTNIYIEPVSGKLVVIHES